MVVSSNPVGVKTVTSGVATLPAGELSVFVDHLLFTTPLISSISLTPTTASSVGWWVSDVTSTRFKINIGSNTSGVSIAWRAAAPGN